MTDYDSIFQSAGQEWNVDPQLLKAVAAQESGGNPHAVSKANAQGVMQIIPETQKYLGITDPTDPVQSIYGGAKYLSKALDAEKTPEDALRYYHGGPNWRDAYGPESQAYAPAVTARYQKLAPAPSPSPTAPGPQPVATSTAPTDPDEAAGMALIKSMATGGGKPAAVPTDPDEAAGMALVHSLAPAQSLAAAAPPTSSSPVVVGNVAPTGISPIDSALSGGIQGVKDVVSTGANIAKWVDDRVPALARLDANYGTTPNALAANLDADRAAYEASAPGQSFAGGAGRFAGNMLASAPLLAPVGKVIGAGVGAAGAVLPDAGAAVNFLGRATGRAIQGGALGGAFGGATSGGSDQPAAANILSGAKAGAIVGPALGLVGEAGSAALGSVSPEVAKLAQLARDKYGIPINAPQMSGSSVMRIANDQSAHLPFSGAAPAAAAQQAAWQTAVSRTMGENAPLITPEVMSKAAGRIGGVFNDVAKRTNITADDQLLSRLGTIESESGSAPLGAGGSEAIKAQIGNVMDAAAKGNGTISGDAYQQLTRAGTPLQRATQAADPNVRHYASQVRDALDDAFQRSAAPEDQAALTQARGQWRAMKTIEDLVEKSPDGNLSPALLMGQVRNASTRFDGSTSGMAYTGGGDLGDLARIGQRFLKTPPNSGTPDRMLINSLIGGAGAGAGFAHPLAGLAIPAGLVANRLGGAYMRSGGLANRLIKNALVPP